MSINNVDKILSYIYPVTAEPIEFKDATFPRIDHLYLRKSLFYGDDCLICGKCCIAEANVFLPFEVERMDGIICGDELIDNITHKTNNRGLDNIKELRESLQPFEVVVNGKSFLLYSSKLTPNIYTFPDRGVLKRCHWDLPTEDGRLGCGIHQVSSLTCQMPHIRFLYRKDRQTTSIGTMQYGRNWAMKCPVEFDKNCSIDRLPSLLQKFELLNRYSEYFEIKTHVSKIIEVLGDIQSELDVNKVCDIDIVSLHKYHPRRLF